MNYRKDTFNFQNFTWAAYMQPILTCSLSASRVRLLGTSHPSVRYRHVIFAGLIAETFPRPADIEALHRADAISRKVRFKHLRLESIYPVEMFPYCDQLARLMNTYPMMTSIGSLPVWYRMQLTPATTLHYDYRDKPAFEEIGSTPVYMPKSLILILLLIKPFDLVYRAFRRLFQRKP